MPERKTTRKVREHMAGFQERQKEREEKREQYCSDSLPMSSPLMRRKENG